jgi:hypothetical protein
MVAAFAEEIRRLLESGRSREDTPVFVASDHQRAASAVREILARHAYGADEVMVDARGRAIRPAIVVLGPASVESESGDRKTVAGGSASEIRDALTDFLVLAFGCDVILGTAGSSFAIQASWAMHPAAGTLSHQHWSGAEGGRPPGGDSGVAYREI